MARIRFLDLQFKEGGKPIKQYNNPPEDYSEGEIYFDITQEDFFILENGVWIPFLNASGDCSLHIYTDISEFPQSPSEGTVVGLEDPISGGIALYVYHNGDYEVIGLSGPQGPKGDKGDKGEKGDPGVVRWGTKEW